MNELRHPPDVVRVGYSVRLPQSHVVLIPMPPLRSTSTFMLFSNTMFRARLLYSRQCENMRRMGLQRHKAGNVPRQLLRARQKVRVIVHIQDTRRTFRPLRQRHFCTLLYPLRYPLGQGFCISTSRRQHNVGPNGPVDEASRGDFPTLFCRSSTWAYL